MYLAPKQWLQHKWTTITWNEQCHIKDHKSHTKTYATTTQTKKKELKIMYNVWIWKKIKILHHYIIIVYHVDWYMKYYRGLHEKSNKNPQRLFRCMKEHHAVKITRRRAYYFYQINDLHKGFEGWSTYISFFLMLF